MGSSGCTLLSNAYVTIRDERYREMVRQRFFILSFCAALMSVILVQMLNMITGQVHLSCLTGMLVCSASCIMMMFENGMLTNVCKTMTVLGTVMVLFPLV